MQHQWQRAQTQHIICINIKDVIWQQWTLPYQWLWCWPAPRRCRLMTSRDTCRRRCSCYVWIWWWARRQRPQYASRLTVSPPAVSRYVRHINSKLNITSNYVCVTWLCFKKYYTYCLNKELHAQSKTSALSMHTNNTPQPRKSELLTPWWSHVHVGVTSGSCTTAHGSVTVEPLMCAPFCGGVTMRVRAGNTETASKHVIQATAKR